MNLSLRALIFLTVKSKENIKLYDHQLMLMMMMMILGSSKQCMYILPHDKMLPLQLSLIGRRDGYAPEVSGACKLQLLLARLCGETPD